MKYALAFILLLLFFNDARPQSSTFRIHPSQTDPAYLAGQDSHAVTIDTGLPASRLMLFLVGTNASTDDYQPLRNNFAGLGVDVVCLSYPDTVAAASLAGDTDSLAFDHFRQELCYGTALSPVLDIDTLNSIYTRFLKLLQYLAANNTSRNWGQYLASPSDPDWSKIVVAGHSQGAGHAAYLAKFEPVERILMFSGPNDYSNHFSAPAPWLSQPGLSPPSRHFSYLSLNDEIVNYYKQFDNALALGLGTSADSTLVDPISSPYGGSRLLYTVQPTGLVILNHNVPVKNTAKNREVWEYMLSMPILTSTSAIPEYEFQVYPNPASGNAWLQGLPRQKGEGVYVFDLLGKVAQHFTTKGDDRHLLDLSKLTPGVYFVRCQSKTIRLLVGGPD